MPKSNKCYKTQINKNDNNNNAQFVHSTSQASKAKSKSIFASNNKKKKEKCSIEEEWKIQIESDIKELWRLFVNEYNYELYSTTKNITGAEDGYSNISDNQLIPLEVKYRLFLLKNQIEILINNMLKTYSDESSFALGYIELWIIHIKIIIEQKDLTLTELIMLFSSAVNQSQYTICSNNTNTNSDDELMITLFGFFIIFLIEYIDKGKKLLISHSQNHIHMHMQQQKQKLFQIHNQSMPIMPKCFNNLWKINRGVILSIIRDNNYSKLFQLSTKTEKAKKTKATESSSFHTPQMKKKKMVFHKEFDIVTDLKSAKILDNSICQHGNYALIELSPNVQESTGHKFVFTPIKRSLNNKIEVSADIKEVNDKYKDILYHPYDEAFALKIKGNERLSFG